MADVTLGLSNHPLSREENGVTFVVHDRPSRGGGKLGELRISKGGLRWWTRGQKSEPHFCSWEDFDAFMREK